MKNILSKFFGKDKGKPKINSGTEEYFHVTSAEKAVELEKEGKLFKVLLFPAEFGGEDVPANVVYVPRGVVEARDLIIGTLIRFTQDGLINQLSVNPEYKKESFVPSKINMRAWHSEKKGGEFNPSIEIW